MNATVWTIIRRKTDEKPHYNNSKGVEIGSNQTYSPLLLHIAQNTFSFYAESIPDGSLHARRTEVSLDSICACCHFKILLSSVSYKTQKFIRCISQTYTEPVNVHHTSNFRKKLHTPKNKCPNQKIILSHSICSLLNTGFGRFGVVVSFSSNEPGINERNSITKRWCRTLITFHFISTSERIRQTMLLRLEVVFTSYVCCFVIAIFCVRHTSQFILF